MSYTHSDTSKPLPDIKREAKIQCDMLKFWFPWREQRKLRGGKNLSLSWLTLLMKKMSKEKKRDEDQRESIHSNHTILWSLSGLLATVPSVIHCWDEVGQYLIAYGFDGKVHRCRSLECISPAHSWNICIVGLCRLQPGRETQTINGGQMAKWCGRDVSEG